MSRIGKKPIQIPEGVTVEINGCDVLVKGKKGQLSFVCRPEIAVEKNDMILNIKEVTHSKTSNAFWGMTRALIANTIQGVNEGFEKTLDLVGVGYRAKSSGTGVMLTLGYSHPIEFKAPEGIQIEVLENTKISIKGIDKSLVGQTAAKLRSLRKPEPYKGKGVRYSTEQVKTKPGKTGKV